MNQEKPADIELIPREHELRKDIFATQREAEAAWDKLLAHVEPEMKRLAQCRAESIIL